MAEDGTAFEGSEDGGIASFDELEPKRLSGKKIMLIALAALVLLGGGAAALLMFGGDGGNDDEKADTEAAKKPQVIFVEIPEFVVNLNTGGDQSHYLRASVSLEVASSSAQAAVEEKLPRILDDFQVYLRELRIQDLNGSAGLENLKQELMRRLNRSVAPARVEDVLFREMLVQ